MKKNEKLLILFAIGVAIIVFASGFYGTREIYKNIILPENASLKGYCNNDPIIKGNQALCEPKTTCCVK